MICLQIRTKYEKYVIKHKSRLLYFEVFANAKIHTFLANLLKRQAISHEVACLKQ